MMEVKSEYKMTELGEIPVDWEIEELKNVSDVVTGSTPKTNNLNLWEGKYMFVTPSDMKSQKYMYTTARYITDEALTLSRAIPKMSIMVTCIASIGKIAIATQNCVTNQQINAITPSSEYNSEYLYYYLLKSKSKLELLASQTTVPIINKSTFSKFKIVLPSLKEQQKIAEILSAVDKQIEQTNQLIEKTKELKKGLIQQLLTKGIGHTEFKQSELGEIPIDWIIEKLEKTAHILDGKRKPIKKNDRISGDIPYYGATGIIDRVNNYLFNETLVLVGEDGENLNSRVLPMAFKISGKTWINNHAHVLKPIENINIDYLTYFLESVNYSIYITGSAQPKLNQEQLRKILILIPPFLEQQKIAGILSAVDEDIEGYKEEKVKYEELKKGLMQQLLTGKTLVKVD